MQGLGFARFLPLERRRTRRRRLGRRLGGRDARRGLSRLLDDGLGRRPLRRLREGLAVVDPINRAINVTSFTIPTVRTDNPISYRVPVPWSQERICSGAVWTFGIVSWSRPWTFGPPPVNDWRSIRLRRSWGRDRSGLTTARMQPGRRSGRLLACSGPCPALKHFIGQTPARVMRGEQQLSFLYKTAPVP